MKSTGIIRRIDDLGRIVIPKELRRTYRVHEGDPMELYADAEGIVIKKYSTMGTIFANANICAKTLHQNFGATVLICDTDTVIAASSNLVETRNHTISDELIQKIRSGKEYLCPEGGDTLPPFIKDDGNYFVQLVIPVQSFDEICGAVILLDAPSPHLPQDILLRGARMAADLLKDGLED